MDSSVIAHPEMVQTLERLAQEQRIPFQRDVMVSGGTDAGSIHMSRAGYGREGFPFRAGICIPPRRWWTWGMSPRQPGC